MWRPLTVNLNFHIISKHDDKVQIWKKRGKLAINNSSYHETAAKKNHDYPNKSYDTLNVLSSFLQNFVPVKLRIISSLSVMAICLLIRKNFAKFFRSSWETYMTQTTLEMVAVLRNFHYTWLTFARLVTSYKVVLFCQSPCWCKVLFANQKQVHEQMCGFMACTKCLIARAVLNTCAKLKKHVQSVYMQVQKCFNAREICCFVDLLHISYMVNSFRRNFPP